MLQTVPVSSYKALHFEPAFDTAEVSAGDGYRRGRMQASSVASSTRLQSIDLTFIPSGLAKPAFHGLRTLRTNDHARARGHNQAYNWFKTLTSRL